MQFPLVRATQAVPARNTISTTKGAMLLALKTEFTLNQEATVNPLNFANLHMPSEDGVRDSYIADVCHELPFAIVKDNILIKSWNCT